MPYPKSHKLEKLSINSVTGDALEVLDEMLMLMAERTHCDNNNMELVHTGPDLKYFGVGHQIKISKLADSLYSTMKDVLVFVMGEMAKESSIDYKFQVPKHTSFVGSIIKSVAIDVIAHNPAYREYLDGLCNSTGKYGFDANQEIFLSIYRDTVLKLDERGYLFESDPELLAIQGKMKGIPQISSTGPITPLSISPDDIMGPVTQQMIAQEPVKQDDIESDPDSDSEDDYERHKSISRLRIILPYLRRLFETRKSAIVTRKRIESIQTFCEPDDEVKAVFNEKMNEYLNSSQNQVDTSPEVVRYHCVYMALSYLKEHFSKERVDLMEKSLKSDKSVATKARKRYVKVPSGKRPHLMEPLNSDMPLSIPEPAHPDGLVSIL